MRAITALLNAAGVWRYEVGGQPVGERVPEVRGDLGDPALALRGAIAGVTHANTGDERQTAMRWFDEKLTAWRAAALDAGRGDA